MGLTTCRAVRPTKHQQVSGNLCAMTTVVDPLDDLDSNSLFTVRILRFSVLIPH